eukprot:m.870442 g.870442  ORF g.870442 m.870442 type:complete len:534 (-) comp23566_c0_seq8:1823-3424(-)
MFLHVFSAILLSGVASAKTPPHILFIVSDDLGFNDVSFHGSNQIPTPHIDSIANRGIKLMNYHVQPVCSPTRSTFMSGRHVIHTGIYMPFSQGTALRLHLNYTLLPEYLKKCCNYSTHMVGKWHLGQNVMKSLPIGRGFDTYLGYWSGAEDYYTHDTKGAYDFNDDVAPKTLRVAAEYNLTYSTSVFTQRAVDIISSFSPTSEQPMFLYLPYQNVHWPLEAPDDYVAMFANTTGGNKERNMVCAMAKILDDGVGNVTQALKDAGIFDTTLVIFSSDNGGPTNGNEGTASNNFPLRGGKNTIWEGGTRVVGAIAGPGIPATGATTFTKFHAADWMPTLVSMASGQNWANFVAKDEPPYQLGDGMDLWAVLSQGADSPRDWLLLECHPDPPQGGTIGEHGNALIVGDMKIIKLGQTHPEDENGNFPPPGQDPTKTEYLMKCNAAGGVPRVGPASATECTDQYCLFNITADPCEYHDLAKTHPDVVQELLTRLKAFQATTVPPVEPEGCSPVQVILPGGARAWQPCDGPHSQGETL